ncbi:hypothetical protein ACH3XW_50525 [Acanthocheilonema viteae]
MWNAIGKSVFLRCRQSSILLYSIHATVTPLTYESVAYQSDRNTSTYHCVRLNENRTYLASTIVLRMQLWQASNSWSKTYSLAFTELDFDGSNI